MLEFPYTLVMPADDAGPRYLTVHSRQELFRLAELMNDILLQDQDLARPHPLYPERGLSLPTN